jgi:hypothetical protein
LEGIEVEAELGLSHEDGQTRASLDGASDPAPQFGRDLNRRLVGVERRDRVYGRMLRA